MSTGDNHFHEMEAGLGGSNMQNLTNSFPQVETRRGQPSSPIAPTETSLGHLLLGSTPPYAVIRTPPQPPHQFNVTESDLGMLPNNPPAQQHMPEFGGASVFGGSSSYAPPVAENTWINLGNSTQTQTTIWDSFEFSQEQSSLLHVTNNQQAQSLSGLGVPIGTPTMNPMNQQGPAIPYWQMQQQPPSSFTRSYTYVHTQTMISVEQAWDPIDEVISYREVVREEVLLENVQIRSTPHPNIEPPTTEAQIGGATSNSNIQEMQNLMIQCFEQWG